jgi:peptidoglycan/LPS O-acetylase OafA/YrhL
MIQGRELADKKFQMDSLDGLRGLAVLIVFLSHTSNDGTYLLPHADFSGIGKSGVFLFFVLSSFLLTLPFVSKGRQAFTRNFILNYAVRRFFRIYPLYFLFLLLGLVTSLIFSQVLSSDKPVGIPFYLSVNDFIAQLALIQGEGVTWSILVEFRYYFLLPFLALVYAIILKNKIVPSIVLTIFLILVGEAYWPESESVTNDVRLGPYLPIFFLGFAAGGNFSQMAGECVECQ